MAEIILSPALVRAAQYVRMSSEHQFFSIEVQKVAIAQYAVARGYEIVATYADEGKSGLSLKGRAGLKKLLVDAINPCRSFSAILIYDVSRWGRFRDPDEAAHYEFLCRQAGVAVVYCAEPFENDFSPTSGIVKNLKRIMAHEYSRELSEKLTRAHLQQARLGYRQGGTLIYGFSRQLVDASNNPKFTLRPGQSKAVRTDRVRVAPGADTEREIVRLIFHLCVDEGLSLKKTALHLETIGVPSKDGRPWSWSRVRAVLKSELCIGWYLYNRTSQKLQARPSRNPTEAWVRVRSGLPSIISDEVFANAQACLAARRTEKLDSEKLLQDLRTLVATKGYLTSSMIAAAPGLASLTAYKNHFGTLGEAYRRIGYVRPICLRPDGRSWTREGIIKTLREIYRTHGYLSGELLTKHADLPSLGTIIRKLGAIGQLYALISAAPKTHAEVVKEAMARVGDKLRGKPLRWQRSKRFPTEYIIEHMKALLSVHGYLSVTLLKADKTLPSLITITERFGSVVKAYNAAGWKVDHSELAKLRHARRYAHAAPEIHS